MARTRTTKKLAQRVDLNYFKRPTPFKRAKLWLSVLVPLLALGWLAWRGITRDSRVYSSGRMSEAHAVLEKQCAACHVQKAGEFSSKPADEACLACHDGPVHHENEVRAAVPQCATCHVEHRGRVNISEASNRACTECHANLRVTGPIRIYAAHIRTLEDGHPEFAALRSGATDPGTIKLNHSLHMRAIRRGPNGPMVQLACGDCHRPAALNAVWPYADNNYVAGKTWYQPGDLGLLPRDALVAPRPFSGRETPVPVRFATACAGCHLLTFDQRFDIGVPHDDPEAVHAFLVKTFTEYIAKHPDELHEVREPHRDLTGKPVRPLVRTVTSAEWIAERTAQSQELLWRKTCVQCHVFTRRYESSSGPPHIAPWVAPTAEAQFDMSSRPEIAPSRTRSRWLPHAKFDHDAHRGFACVGCHAKALTSTETSDLLVPGIENCRTCHAPGPEHTESRCFACHTYHDWSKRKEVRPVFTLPGLRAGGG